jgi:hypothetical protein
MTSKEEKKTAEEIKSDRQDWLLENFVLNATLLEANIGITLMVGGIVITGTLIGVKEYFREFGKLLATGHSSLSSNNIIKQYEDIGLQTFQDMKTEYEEGPEIVLNRLTYIHLKNAKILHGNLLIPNGADFLWRGRLIEIDGFALGSLSHPKPTD